MLRRLRKILGLVLRLGLLAIRLGVQMDDASRAMAATIKFLFIPDWVASCVIASRISWSFMITKDRVMKQKCSFGGGSVGDGGILQSDLLRRYASKFCFDVLLEQTRLWKCLFVLRFCFEDLTLRIIFQ